MIKKLSSHGNSLCLVIEKSIMELLKWTPETDLEITTDGKNLTVKKAKKIKHKIGTDGMHHNLFCVNCYQNAGELSPSCPKPKSE